MYPTDQINCRRLWRWPGRPVRLDAWVGRAWSPDNSFAEHRLRRLAATLLVALPPLVSAQTFTSNADDESGAILLSNIAVTPAPQQVPDAITLPGYLVRQAEAAPPNDAAQRHAPKAATVIDLRQLIAQVALDSGVGADLIAAIAAAESRFDPTARSPKGALGLMQLMPATAERFGVRDVWAVEDNLRGGAAYLRWLLDFFGGDTRLAVAAYNAGEHAVIKAGWRIPSFGETRTYVPRVLAWSELYAAEFKLPDKAKPATATKPHPDARNGKRTHQHLTYAITPQASGPGLASR